MGKTAIVTGGSSGIGKSVCEELAKLGIKVYEFSRRDAEDKDNIIHVCTDVSLDESVNASVRKVLEAEKKVDILVCCAGFGISGAVEFTDTETAKKQFDVNFFGAVRCVKSLLTPMRKAGEGRIVIVSSVAAPIPIPFQTYYSASKAALNSYVCALDNEVKPYGIKVCAVEPGDIKTGFTAARNKIIEGDAEYGGRISNSVKVMEHDEENGMSPSVVGKFIAKCAVKKNIKPLYAVGFKYKFFTVLMAALPCRFSNWLLGLIYGG